MNNQTGSANAATLNTASKTGGIPAAVFNLSKYRFNRRLIHAHAAVGAKFGRCALIAKPAPGDGCMGNQDGNHAPALQSGQIRSANAATVSLMLSAISR